MNTTTCPKNMWARQINGRGMRSKRYLSCVLASLLRMAIALRKKVRDLKSYLLNVYTRKQNQRVQR
jgi:hypothetical protein